MEKEWLLSSKKITKNMNKGRVSEVFLWISFHSQGFEVLKARMEQAPLYYSFILFLLSVYVYFACMYARGPHAYIYAHVP